MGVRDRAVAFVESTMIDDPNPMGKLMRVLDHTMDRLGQSTTPGDQLERLRGEAQGLAQAVSIICFATVDEVKQAAQHRWVARQQLTRSRD